MDFLNRTHRRLSFSYFTLALVCILFLSMTGAEASTKRIVLIGDSWTQWPWKNGAFQEVLDGTGTGAAVEGTYTAIGGTAALWWAQNAVPDPGSFPPPPGTSPNPAGWGLLDRLDYTLNNNPTIDIVHMSLGGIDMLASWRNGWTAEQEEALFTQIADNIQTVVNHVRARADGERFRFLWVDYDYLNITETCTKYMDEYSDDAALASAVLGFSVGIPLCDNALCIYTALMQNKANNEVINRAFGRCALMKIQAHQTMPGVRYIQNFGNVQYRAGYTDSLGTIFAPGVVPFPGVAPSFSPLPGGDPAYGTPPPLMDKPSGKVDPIHLSKTGYKYIFDNCWAQYYARWIADSVRPSCTGIARLSGNPTLPGNVGFSVTFSEAVVGVDAEDFVLDVEGLENAAITGVSGSGTAYTVTVYTGTAGAVAGTVGLDLVDNDTIYDGADNYLLDNFLTGEVYTVEPEAEGEEGPLEGAVEGAIEGVEEGSSEGVTEGEAEGMSEGAVEGAAEGLIEGQEEGLIEGEPQEGQVEGVNEGQAEGEEGEGHAEGLSEGAEEGQVEGAVEGLLEGEGVEEGMIEGQEEGVIEGSAEGVVEGQPEGAVEGIVEGVTEGIMEGEPVEGMPEGLLEGEGGGEGEGLLEGEGVPAEGSLEEGMPSEGSPEEGQVEGGVEGEGEAGVHSADENGDGRIDLSEVLRLIQFFNSGGYHCQAGTEDGYAPGLDDTSCAPHSSDYNAQDWMINLSELLRVIQFFNSGGYHACVGSEDGFCPGV